MGSVKELEELFAEAERQGFVVERKGGTHYALRPPDKTKAIVNLSSSGHEGRTVQNAIAALRRAGLVYPPGQGIVRRTDPGSGVGKLEREEPPPQVLTMRIVPQPPPPPDEERIFRDLKESKEYARMAREQLAECEARHHAATRALDNAREEVVRADAVLREKKGEFDRAFDAA